MHCGNKTIKKNFLQIGLKGHSTRGEGNFNKLYPSSTCATHSAPYWSSRPITQSQQIKFPIGIEIFLELEWIHLQHNWPLLLCDCTQTLQADTLNGGCWFLSHLLANARISWGVCHHPTLLHLNKPAKPDPTSPFFAISLWKASWHLCTLHF